MSTHRTAKDLGLERDEVHLWWRSLADEELLGAARGWLSAEELERAQRFQRPSDARAFVARRGFLRQRLGEYLGWAPAALEFRAGRFGKPALAAPRAALDFNLSRAGDWCLLGVARGRALGVDLERVDPRLTGAELARLAERVLASRERAELAHVPERERPAAFVRAWTRKEALLKALGTGLSREPDTLDVGLEPLAPLAARTLSPELFPRASGGLLLDLIAPPGHMASVVAAGRGWNLVQCSRPVA